MSDARPSNLKPSQTQPGSARSLIIATAGHVDHGKTSLVNRITGTDTDTLAEEKSRGLTINLGYAYHHFDTESDGVANRNTIGFVDVPGHTDFINNMLAGVGAVDAALLVVAADDGIMPQTREHLAILDLLGVSTGLVALTKIDRCDEQRLVTVTEEIQQLLHGTTLSGAPIFPLSNTNGDGVPALIKHLHTLIKDNSLARDNSSNKYFRYLIDRCFTVKGIGTVVTGSVRAGSAQLGDTLLHSDSEEQTKLRGLRQDATDLDSVHQGMRAAANIGLGHKQLKRGDWLLDSRLYKPVNRFDASLRMIDQDLRPKGNTQYHLHIGASHYIVRLHSLADQRGRYYQIKSNELIHTHYGDRFVIRDPASQHTLGGGQVVDIYAPRRRRSSEARLAALEAMDQADLAAIKSLLQVLTGGLNLQQFALCRNITDAAIELLLDQLKADAIALVSLTVDKQNLAVLLGEKYFQRYSQQIQEQLAAYHLQHGNQQGISEPALSKAVDFDDSHLLFHSILQLLVQQSVIKRTGTLLHLPNHAMALSQEEEEFLAKVRPILLKAGNVPPRTRELVDLTDIALPALERILRVSTKAGNLIQVAGNRHYLPDTIMALAEFTEKLAADSASDEGFSVVQFRDASGIGRNLCIEILEYFDRVGYTRRDGNSRFIRTDKDNVFGR